MYFYLIPTTITLDSLRVMQYNYLLLTILLTIITKKQVLYVKTHMSSPSISAENMKEKLLDGILNVTGPSLLFPIWSISKRVGVGVNLVYNQIQDVIEI